MLSGLICRLRSLHLPLFMENWTYNPKHSH